MISAGEEMRSFFLRLIDATHLKELALKFSIAYYSLCYSKARRKLLQRFLGSDAQIKIDFKKLNITSKNETPILCFDPSDEGASVDLYAWGFREPIHTYMLYNFLARESAYFDCVMDIGSHIGYFPLIEHESGVESIIAIEPNPYIYTYLKGNSCHFKNVKTLNIAVSNRDGYVTMLLSKRSNFSRVVEESAYTKPCVSRSAEKVINVRALSLKTIIDSMGLRGANVFLRMDVEGYEKVILEKLPNEVCGISFELHPHIIGWESTISLFKKLFEMGFKTEILTYEGVYMYPVIKFLGISRALQLFNPILLEPDINKSKQFITEKLQPHIFMLRV
jgi:FkbM family methyltransferase